MPTLHCEGILLCESSLFATFRHAPESIAGTPSTTLRRAATSCGWPPLDELSLASISVSLVKSCICCARAASRGNHLPSWVAVHNQPAVVGHYFLLAWRSEIAHWSQR